MIYKKVLKEVCSGLVLTGVPILVILLISWGLIEVFGKPITYFLLGGFFLGWFVFAEYRRIMEELNKEDDEQLRDNKKGTNDQL